MNLTNTAGPDISTSVQSLFVAYFGRPADVIGMQYWANLLNDGKSTLAQVAAQFAQSTEFRTSVGGSNADVVNKLYNTMFGHNADVSGLLYWTQLLSDGKLNVATLPGAIGQAAVGSDAIALRDKLVCANTFDTLMELSGASAIIGYSGSQVEVVKAWLATVTDDMSMANALSALAHGALSPPVIYSNDPGMWVIAVAPVPPANFSAGQLQSTSASISSSVQALYVSLLGRPADAGGMAYWADVAQKSHTLANVQQGIVQSAEFSALFAGKSTVQAIDTIYLNSFGRHAEADGLLYWSAKVAGDQSNLPTIAAQIAAGAMGNDDMVLTDKLVVANAFDSYWQLSQSSASDIVNDATALRPWLAQVTDANSMAAALRDLAHLSSPYTVTGVVSAPPPAELVGVPPAHELAI